MLLRSSLLAWLLIGIAGASRAGDWPHWRGPTHDGHVAEANIVDALPPGGLPVLWMRQLGQGYSGFAVVGDRAYTQFQTLYGQELVCLDAGTGKTLWSHKYAPAFEAGGLYPGPRATPAVADGKVFYVSPEGLVGCVAADNGKLLWELNFIEKFHGQGTDFGYSCSPLVIDGLVILPVGGANASVVALRVADGSTAWQAGSRPASYATALPITWREHALVIVLLQNTLACHDRRTGELWWELPLSHGYDEHAAAPLYREPHLVISGPFQAGAQQFVLEEDPETHRCRPVRGWDSPKLSNDVASSVLVDGMIYGFDLRDPQARLHRTSRGEFRAFDAQSGNVLWSSAEPGHAQVIAADGKLLFFTDVGELVLAEQSRAAYRELGRMTLFGDEICWTMPALANDRLFVRTQSQAACVYVGKRPLARTQTFLKPEQLSRRQRFDTATLLGAEREYPATLPERSECLTWFAWSLALLAGCELIAALLLLTMRRLSVTHAEQGMLILAILAGAVGSRLLHAWPTEYVFTWPLALWGAFQLTLTFSRSVPRERFISRERLLSYGVGAGFLLLCLLYFLLCRALGMAIEWVFLVGFIGALPAALLAQWLIHHDRWWSRALLSIVYPLSFSTYYWSSVWFMYFYMHAPN